MRRSYFLAAGIIGLVALWMLSGVLFGGDPTADTADDSQAAAQAVPQVRVAAISAQTMVERVTINARSEPVRMVDLRTEVNGRVVALPVERGERVEAGTVLIELDRQDRLEAVAEARAILAQRRTEATAARELSDRGFTSDIRRAETEAALEAARAGLRRAELALANSEIVAPFDGVLESRSVEIGDYADRGESIARFVDLSAIKLVGYVTEEDIGHITLGAVAQSEILDIGLRTGTVTYLAQTADLETRTFRVEVTLENTDGRLRGGMTARLIIPLDNQLAHLVPLSALTLDDAGSIGIKVVDADNTVRFLQAKLLADTSTGVWLGGLPADLTLITVGQEFVSTGQRVEPVHRPLSLVGAEEAG